MEIPNGDLKDLLYEAIVGRIRYDRALGGLLDFRGRRGALVGRGYGKQLEGLHRDLILGRRQSTRVAEAVTAIEEDLNAGGG